MLKKYTIFDNFDKLDLSPAAELIIEDAQVTKLSGDTTNSGLLDNFIFGKFNDTIFPDSVTLENFSTPFAFNMAKYFPDMYRFVTNRRFFIDKGGMVKHTSEFVDFDSASTSGPNPLVPKVRDIGTNRNIFGQQFFFNIYVNDFVKFLSNNIVLYNNKMISGNGAIDNYFAPGEGLNLVPLNVQSTFSGWDKPFLDGLNRNIFIPYRNDGLAPQGLLFYFDLLPGLTGPNSNGLTDQADYISQNLGEEGVEALRLFIQRVLYPIKTLDATVPSHTYFVADLDKSAKISEDLIPYSDTKEVVTTPVYNYYKEEYERFSSNVELEWQLPNAYAFYSFLKAGKQDPLYSYYGNIVKIDSNGNNLSDFSIDKYYKLSGQSSTHLDETDDAGLSKYLSLLRHKCVSFGREIDQISEGIKSIKKVLPYYNEIEVPSFHSTLVNSLNEENLLSQFMTLIGSYFSGLNGNRNLHNLHTFSLFNTSEEGMSDPSVSLSTLQILDLNYNHAKYYKFLSDTKNILKFATNNIDTEDTKAFKLYYAHILQEKIKSYSNQRGLTFKQIDKGEKCYTEVLALEVAKYKVVDGQRQHIQSFYIPCLNQKGKTLLDTQIFYGQDYIYETYSISLVVGAEYTSELNIMQSKQIATDPLSNSLFKDFEIADTVGTNVFNLNRQNVAPAFVTNPRVTLKPILVRAPYDNVSSILGSRTQEITTLLDYPPLPPEITFNSFKDVEDKVLISLNVNYGQRKMKPIATNGGDAAAIETYRNSQKHLKLPYGEVLYRTDDFNGTYIIYRTTTKPVSWNPFQEIKSINNEQLSAFEDKVVPNVDYYYYAKFVDLHGNVSNPTSIFYLRIVKEGGFPPYMVLKPYTFAESKHPAVYEKQLKKYMKIKLAEGVRQTINEQDLSKIDINYGKLNSSGQLKKYKIRVTSKKTGKKIDINIDFKKILSDKYLNKDPKGGLSQQDLSIGKSTFMEEKDYTEAKIKAGATEDSLLEESSAMKPPVVNIIEPPG